MAFGKIQLRSKLIKTSSDDDDDDDDNMSNKYY